MRTGPMYVSLVVGIVVTLSGCLDAHERDRDGLLDRDAGADAALLFDAAGEPDSGLAPPCETPPPACVHVLHSSRAVDDVSSSSAREVSVPALVFAEGVVQVLTQVEDPAADRVLLLTRRFDHELAPMAPSPLDSMAQPPRNATGIATHPALFAWAAALGVAGSESIELRWRTVDDTGVASDIRSVPRAWDDTHVGPALADLEHPLALTGRSGAIDVLDLTTEATTTLSVAGTPWDSIRVASMPGDPSALVVLWHTVDDQGFASAMLMVTTADAIRVGPVPALTHLSTRAALLVTADAVFVAGFERTTEVGQSRLRIARFNPSDLSRRGSDASYAGWGGQMPAGFQIVSWHDQIWLAWLTNDARFAADAVVYVQALNDTACAARVDAPLLVSSAPFDWTRRATPGQMAVAAGDDELYVAHTIGDTGLFDVHALGYGCP